MSIFPSMNVIGSDVVIALALLAPRHPCGRAGFASAAPKYLKLYPLDAGFQPCAVEASKNLNRHGPAQNYRERHDEHRAHEPCGRGTSSVVVISFCHRLSLSHFRQN